MTEKNWTRFSPLLRPPTFKGIRSVVELQLEDIIGCSVGVQSRRSGLASPDETVLSAEDDDWTVDELHQELLSLRCAEGMKGTMRHTNSEGRGAGPYFQAVYLQTILTCIINSRSQLTVLLSNHVLPVSCTHTHTTITPLQLE